MAFIDIILQEPSYGWKDENNNVVKPSTKRLWKELFSKLNIFRSKKNWISLCSVAMMVALLPFFYFFLVEYFSLKLLIAFVVYSMIIMGTHGTIWFHRYGTHKAYHFSHPFWRLVTQNLVIKTLPEEIYIVSHHVHHSKSDEPGDPYNAQAGFWYCMLAEFNHQRISPNLTEAEYAKVVHFMKHTGVKTNTYTQYQEWGSVASPVYTVTLWLLNWTFWFTAFYLIGGPGLVCTLFGAALFWFIGVRAFNYTGHGKGEEKHVDGVDFDRSNLSVNQLRPGLFAGEWHNNHHLYPGSARAGFLSYQLDFAWIYIYCLYKIGAVSSYRDSKQDFLRKYVRKQRAGVVQEQV
ncbi:MAG TPA: fatty acid desaturase [Flavisolibacter sp.]|jgi:stearoyl-CoA desaturase (delta-9 desaturase)